MINKQRYTLGKTDKLKSRKTIEHLFLNGNSFSQFPFKVLYSFNKNRLTEEANNSLQTAFGISKKYFKKAVHRNRIKRLMRESWRLQKNTVADKIKTSNNSIAVFIIFTNNKMPDYAMVFKKMALVVSRLLKICDENIIADN